ncbi:uncharacterized protein RCC_01414 [Ramularia collo-cygni]|uniref:Uncharacterized protein n=1 Tax=Ramularia collo-cygni TaxID=112498 RepID=A0A2D3UMP6_9PEZI|nr:uncharacterized protein RCC_01414 [Ramularia collo-cygni]CZT15561.1 uncharacterized protein RCC_01414 [Ramularia collo-cygni]
MEDVVSPFNDHQRSTVTSPTEPRDGPAPPVPSSPANFAFDETVFGTAPLTASPGIDDDEHAPDDEIPYPEAEEGSILPPPDFKPFFTLIEDSTTGEHQHPTVHYLFADDDQEILTAAALETVSHERQEPDDERFVIVDMNADGREVVGISSLSPDWQTLKTKVTQAPSWGDASKSAEKGLMLRISGKEAEAGGDKGRKGDVDGLLKAFDELAGTLDEVLGSSITELDNQIVQ